LNRDNRVVNRHSQLLLIGIHPGLGRSHIGGLESFGTTGHRTTTEFQAL
jgi:hypothetical protein